MAATYVPIATSEEEKFERLEDFNGHAEAQQGCDNCARDSKKRSSFFKITPAKILLALALCPLLYGICHSRESLVKYLSGDYTLDEDKEDVNRAPMCDFATAREITAPKENVFRNLDVDEAVAIRKWLHSSEQGLNLTFATKATSGYVGLSR